MLSERFWICFMILLVSCATWTPERAEAGCGCLKPPPVPAQVRPRATYAGSELHLFHPALEEGGRYRVIIRSATGARKAINVTATTRRDLANATPVAQLSVVLPDLPAGPAWIRVRDRDSGANVFKTNDSALTVVSRPIQIPDEAGEYVFEDYQAAVSRDGIVYLALDLAGMQLPKVIQAQALGYPLRFQPQDVAFWNTQGFLMQALGETMPGVYSLAAAQGSSDSDVLQYSRHEFSTFYLQHEEREQHWVDGQDPNWHLDGTPHIDHDHLILAITGVFDDESLPEAGTTPPFDLQLSAVSLFGAGLVTEQRTELNGDARVVGDVVSNGEVIVDNSARVDGNILASYVRITGGSSVTGEVSIREDRDALMPFDIPPGLEDLGHVAPKPGETLELSRGSYLAASIKLQNGAQLLIDNRSGPVTIYVSESVEVSGGSAVELLDPNPETFALYVSGSGPVRIQNDGEYYGVIYAPNSWFEATGDASFVGSFVSREARVTNSASVTFDAALLGVTP